MWYSNKQKEIIQTAILRVGMQYSNKSKVRDNKINLLILEWHIPTNKKTLLKVIYWQVGIWNTK